MKQIKKDLKRATQHVQAATNEKPFEHIQIATFLLKQCQNETRKYSRSETVHLTMDLVKASTCFMEIVIHAMDDEIITELEFAKIKDEYARLIRDMHGVMAWVEQHLEK